MIAMDVYQRILSGSIVTALVVCAAMGYPQHKPWTGRTLRRQVLPACTSYQSLQELLREDFYWNSLMPVYRQLSKPDTVVTRDTLRSATNTLCIALAERAESVAAILNGCPNTEEVKANMHVFGGLCTDDGNPTAFLNELIADFDSSDAFMKSCEERRFPILMACNVEGIDSREDMDSGPMAYKRILIEQERCNSAGFDGNDLSDCGNIHSLKILAIILDIFFKMGPGVTFSRSEIGL